MAPDPALAAPGGIVKAAARTLLGKIVLAVVVLIWGLRSLFGLSPRTALTVTVLPIAVLLLLFLPYILAPLR